MRVPSAHAPERHVRATKPSEPSEPGPAQKPSEPFPSKPRPYCSKPHPSGAAGRAALYKNAGTPARILLKPYAPLLSALYFPVMEAAAAAAAAAEAAAAAAAAAKGPTWSARGARVM